MKRRGFTIVELLAVIAIISVLITITVSAITGSMQRARAQKTNALCTMVEQGIANYYAQNDEWPISGLENKTANADSNGNQNNTNQKTTYLLTATEVREMVKELIKMTKENNPVMDVSGLFVSTSSGESGSVGYGMDFLTAIHGSKANAKKLKVPQMYFGYPDPNSSRGYFRRFKMYYSPATDTVKVTTL